MYLLVIVLASAAVLTVAYWTYGSLLVRLLGLNANAEVPAVTMRDGVDYEPIESKFLLSQHFSAIAAAGPIVGPILAGIAFGWLPAMIWILVGAVFIGGTHDFIALIASVRHKARSIAEVVREHMSQRSYILFLSFVWIALIYIIVAFTDITAAAFVGQQTLENGQVVSGGGIATSSLLYLAIPIIMGLLLRFTRLTVGWATLLFLPLVGLSIYVGQMLPFDAVEIVNSLRPGLSEMSATIIAKQSWSIALLIYCLIAAVVPMWLLLQPRGHLGGYFLYVALGGGALGLLLGGGKINYPAFTGWTAANGDTLFPFLFIIIACGACSGFHSLIASGTTSKQLRRETDAKVIGYGAMLLEAMVAMVSLSCVMMLSRDSALVATGTPNQIYASGLGKFLSVLGIPEQLAVSFALMAFTTFVYDTLDVCTRLGRYILEELTGWHTKIGKWVATGLTAGLPAFFLLRVNLGADGKPIPVWRTFWNLFGASNQLLAALTLLGITVWLWRTRREAWVWLITGVPAAWMYAMSTWALVSLTWPKFHANGAWVTPQDPVPWVGLVLLALAALMLLEALLVIFRPETPRGDSPSAGQLKPVAAG